MIKINDKYRIYADVDCYAVDYIKSNRQVIDRKTGKLKDDVCRVGYYGTIKSAVKGCRDDALKREFTKSDYTLAEAVKRIDEITKEFENALSVMD